MIMISKECLLMKWLKRSALILLLLPVLSQAAQVEIEVTGTGLTEDLAVEQGLIRAVRQVNGTDINSTQESVQKQSRKNSETHTHLETRQDSALKARGQVAGYDILESRCLASECKVRLAVRVHQYKEAGMSSTNRRKLAVVPFKGGSHKFASQLTEQLQEQLVQSRRFAMLDRTRRKELDAEKALWSSDKTPVSEKAKLGQMLGLDYMLFGTVKEGRVRRWSKKVELTGEEKHYAETIASVRYEMIAVATGQVKWADTVSVRRTGAVLSRTAAAMAKQISEEVLSNIFPLRVVGVTAGQVVLNQGGKTLKKGIRLRIFAVGEKLIDPYTREVLGQAETEVATVKIVRITAKTAYAEVTHGRLDQINSMQIAQTIEAKPNKTTVSHPKPKPQVHTNTKIADEGGVIL